MRKSFFAIFLTMLSVGFVSCNENDEVFSDGDKNEYTVDTEIQILSSELFNTSWTYKYTESYTNGKLSRYNSNYGNRFTFTFTDDINDNNEYKLLVNGVSANYLLWYIDKDGLYYHATNYGYINANMTALEVGGWLVNGGVVMDGHIYKHTDSELIIREYASNSTSFEQHYYTAAGNPGGVSGGGSASYEKPEVGFYDFTATRTSLKVQYRIYNNDEADVNSATIYYGTCSNPTSTKTATVSGSMITANISGLKAGTTYYVKCVAKGKGGITTTSTTKVITNY